MSGDTTTAADLTGRTMLITGGNSGIGLETAAGLAARGATLILACRDTAKGQAAAADVTRRTGNPDIAVLHVDLADLATVESLAERVHARYPSLNVLINNAGLILNERRETAQGFEYTFGANHLGHFHLTNLLADRLVASGRPGDPARVVNLASVGHWFAVGGMSWDDLDRHGRFNGPRVYGESKLANILHVRGLARRFAPTSLVAHAVHPGAVRSGFGKDGDLVGALGRLLPLGDRVLISPERGARTSIHVATAPEAALSSGDYWTRSHRAGTSPWVRDDAAERLWEVSVDLLAGVGFA